MSDSRSHDANEPVPSPLREEILERDNECCQLCRARGPAAGGLAHLEVHHKVPDPEGDRHAEDNLITLCQDCHRWHHMRPTPDEVPVTLSKADREYLRSHDYEILQVLWEKGPMTTGEVADAITPDLTTMAIRERLWRLMALDDRVESRETQLIDQDFETGQWGMAGDIARSERGRIPLSVESLLLRIEDERVRQAVDRDVDRQEIADALGVGYRTTFQKEERARAYQFPLDALGSDHGRPARSTTGNEVAFDGHTAQLQLTDVSEPQAGDTDESDPDDETTQDERGDNVAAD